MTKKKLVVYQNTNARFGTVILHPDSVYSFCPCHPESGRAELLRRLGAIASGRISNADVCAQPTKPACTGEELLTVTVDVLNEGS